MNDLKIFLITVGIVLCFGIVGISISQLNNTPEPKLTDPIAERIYACSKLTAFNENICLNKIKFK